MKVSAISAAASGLVDSMSIDHETRYSRRGHSSGAGAAVESLDVLGDGEPFNPCRAAGSTNVGMDDLMGKGEPFRDREIEEVEVAVEGCVDALHVHARAYSTYQRARAMNFAFSTGSSVSIAFLAVFRLAS